MPEEPEADTEISVNGIAFVDRVMSKYPHVLFHPHHAPLLEFFFLFSIKVLDGNEPLPKAAAAEFWVSLPLYLLRFSGLYLLSHHNPFVLVTKLPTT